MTVSANRKSETAVGEPGPRRHFLPANSIGYFSSMASDEAPKGKRRRRRNRPIWVLRRGQQEPRQDVPNNVAHSREVYHPGMGPMFDADKFFSPFEVMNDDAVTELLADPSPDKTFSVWVRLAAYVASRITRNPDAEFAMAADENFPWPKESRGIGYRLNMQRTCAAVLRTGWELITCKDAEFIINDRGFVGVIDPVWRGPALVVPLRKDAAALLGSGSHSRNQSRGTEPHGRSRSQPEWPPATSLAYITTCLGWGLEKKFMAVQPLPWVQLPLHIPAPPVL